MTKQMLMEMVQDAKSKKNYAKAQEYLLRVLRLQPDNKEAWEELGQCYLETGSLEKSLEAYRRAVALVKGSDDSSGGGK